MLAANQGQNNSLGLPRRSATSIELRPFCSTSSARGAGAGRSIGVSSALVMVAPLRRNPLQPIFPYQRPVNLPPAEGLQTFGEREFEGGLSSRVWLPGNAGVRVDRWSVPGT